MTAIAIQTLNFSTRILEGLYNGVKKTLQGIMMGYMLARQTQANRYIAQRLIHEYPNHTVASLHHELNRKTLQDISDMFK